MLTLRFLQVSSSQATASCTQTSTRGDADVTGAERLLESFAVPVAKQNPASSLGGHRSFYCEALELGASDLACRGRGRGSWQGVNVHTMPKPCSSLCLPASHCVSSQQRPSHVHTAGASLRSQTVVVSGNTRVLSFFLGQLHEKICMIVHCSNSWNLRGSCAPKARMCSFGCCLPCERHAETTAGTSRAGCNTTSTYNPYLSLIHI